MAKPLRKVKKALRSEDPVAPVIEKVVTQGGYTPAAQAQLRQVQVVPTGKMFAPWAVGGYYGGPEPKVEVLWPHQAADLVLAHEYGHFFDDRLGVTGLAGEGAENPAWTRDFNVNQPYAPPVLRGQARDVPFHASLAAERGRGLLSGYEYYPGVFGNPRDPNNWGGYAELYANMNVLPSAAVPASMRPFFPQFEHQYLMSGTTGARPPFEPPPGHYWTWQPFEDGSSGWALRPAPQPDEGYRPGMDEQFLAGRSLPPPPEFGPFVPPPGYDPRRFPPAREPEIGSTGGYGPSRPAPPSGPAPQPAHAAPYRGESVPVRILNQEYLARRGFAQPGRKKMEKKSK